MIIPIHREEYLALIDSKHRHRLRCCTARLIQLFKWLSGDGSKAVQFHGEEIRILLLGEQVYDAIALLWHDTDSIQEAVK